MGQIAGKYLLTCIQSTHHQTRECWSCLTNHLTVSLFEANLEMKRIRYFKIGFKECYIIMFTKNQVLFCHSHWTGSCQACSLSWDRPGVVARHTSSAPASPRPGVIRVELTRRPPSTELWNKVLLLLATCAGDAHLGHGVRQLLPVLPPGDPVVGARAPDLALQPPRHARHQRNISPENLDRERRN